MARPVPVCALSGLFFNEPAQIRQKGAHMFSHPTLVRCIAFVTVLLVGITVAHADIVSNNFGPGDDYGYGSAWSVGLGFPLYEIAEPFRVSDQSYTLDTIELAIALIEGDNHFFLYLMTDDKGKPGQVIEAFQVVGQMPLNNQENPPVVVESVQHPVLEKGVRYWVVAAATVETWAGWYLNSTGDTGPHGQRADRGEWKISNITRCAFRVTGTPVN